MCGKESENYFTSIQRLSDVAPCTQKKEYDLEHHPAFGFKAGLIRVIGNMSYKNKKCQDIVSNTGRSFTMYAFVIDKYRIFRLR